MKMQEIYDQFKGLGNEYTKIVNQVNTIKNDGTRNAQWKNEEVAKQRDKLYSLYGSMIDKAQAKADLLIRDAQEGYRITKIPKLSDTERSYSLQMYQGTLSQMELKDLVDFMELQENITNSVYAENFKILAPTYISKCEPMSGMAEKIGNILSVISMDNIDGLKEIREVKVVLNNLYSLLEMWNSLMINAETGDFNTTESTALIFNLQGDFNNYNGSKSAKEITDEFNFNFKPLVR